MRHSDRRVCFSRDQQIKCACNTRTRNDYLTEPGSFHDVFVAVNPEAALLVALAFRQVTFGTVLLEDRFDISLVADLTRTGNHDTGQQCDRHDRTCLEPQHSWVLSSRNPMHLGRLDGSYLAQLGLKML